MEIKVVANEVVISKRGADVPSAEFCLSKTKAQCDSIPDARYRSHTERMLA